MTDLTSRFDADDLDAVQDGVAHLLASVPQLDDSGANTADRYDWQAAMAAADGLALYLSALSDTGVLRSDCTDRILCEWHEDWVLICDDDIELVSGKHRDPSAGAYTTVTKLLDDAGVAHLFNRWAALTETPTCRVVTSAGIGAGEATKLMLAVGYFKSRRSNGDPVLTVPDHADIVEKVVNKLPEYCDHTKTRWDGTQTRPAVTVPDRQLEVARFLAALSVDENRPQRAHIRAAAPTLYAKPVLDRMGLPESLAAPVWEAVLNLFRARMRARGPIPEGGLPIVAARQSSPAIPEDVRRTLEERTVTVADIGIAIEQAKARPAGYEPLRPLPPLSRLELKMSAAGCSSNAIERATTLRADYQEYWFDRESGDPAARVERKRLERALHGAADRATDSESLPGQLLWRRFETEVSGLSAGTLSAGMDQDVALGGICDLADRCSVWFGPRFDIKASAERIRGGRDDDQ
ncbi:hypothetical protein C5E44_03535 [Nocardia nova]|uniref:hypothetical protein n=1 Tax=Nocardia nova TaxID=37330 RepID=UPI000CEA5CFC|nr:hypothetical protein C5E44_03535 [Nocardia nova]